MQTPRSRLSAALISAQAPLFVFSATSACFSRYGQDLEAVKNNDLTTPQIDLDTGSPTERGEYPLADATYRELLDELADQRFANVDETLRSDILAFYAGFSMPTPGTTRLQNCVAQRMQKTAAELTLQRAANLQDPEPAASSKTPSGELDTAAAAYGCD